MKAPSTQSRQASLTGAVGFVLAVLLLAVLEATHTKADPITIGDNERVGKLMLCVVLAAATSIVSLVTGVYPLTKGDWWPLAWLGPLVLGWALLLRYLLFTFEHWHSLT